jgi:hypothetical protein
MAKYEFGGYFERGQLRSPEYQIVGCEPHPLIRGFLKLLGTMVIVPMAVLPIIIGDDCSPSDGASVEIGDICRWRC